MLEFQLKNIQRCFKTLQSSSCYNVEKNTHKYLELIEKISEGIGQDKLNFLQDAFDNQPAKLHEGYINQKIQNSRLDQESVFKLRCKSKVKLDTCQWRGEQIKIDEKPIQENTFKKRSPTKNGQDEYMNEKKVDKRLKSKDHHSRNSNQKVFLENKEFGYKKPLLNFSNSQQDLYNEDNIYHSDDSIEADNIGQAFAKSGKINNPSINESIEKSLKEYYTDNKLVNSPDFENNSLKSSYLAQDHSNDSELPNYYNEQYRKEKSKTGSFEEAGDFIEKYDSKNFDLNGKKNNDDFDFKANVKFNLNKKKSESNDDESNDLSRAKDTNSSESVGKQVEEFNNYYNKK